MSQLQPIDVDLQTAMQDARKKEKAALRNGKSIRRGLLNMQENRYADVLAYDHSLVSLHSGKYINASIINDTFIATQAPLPHTFHTFWTMIVEHEISVILMVANASEVDRNHRMPRVHQYWPRGSAGSAQYYPRPPPDNSECSPNTRQIHEAQGEGIVVRLLSKTQTQLCTILKLEVANSHRLFLIQYPAWPDFGVPESGSDILSLLDLAFAYKADTKSRIVIHCSAGCGRTGTVIAIDEMRARLWRGEVRNEAEVKEALIDVLRGLRMKRVAMIQTESQLQFVYNVILELARAGNLWRRACQDS